MKKKVSIILISLFSVSIQAYEGLPLEQVGKFFKDISSDKINEAVDNLYSNNPAIKNKTQAITIVKQQLISIKKLFGKNIGNEMIHNEKLSASITHIVQVSKYELHPIVWEFYFYKPKDKWIISDARFNDQFQSLDSKKR